MQNCVVRTVFLRCNTFLYNYNQFECSDLMSELLHVTNADTEMHEVDE